MYNQLRVVVLVSPDISDIYFANQLMKKVNVVGVFVENQSRKTSLYPKLQKFFSEPTLLPRKIKNRFYEGCYNKKAAKIAFEGFGYEGKKIFASASCEVFYTKGVNDINEPVNIEEIRKLKPDIIAVCGSSILKKPLLSIPPKGVLNLHGGLAQKYRGVWTTMWAIHNGEPENVGLTVHYVSEGVDDGNYIYQGRPEIVEDDNHETLYVKVVKLGIDLMVKAINDIQDGTVKSYPVVEKGKLYLRSSVTQDVLRETWQKVESGLIREYVKRSKKADS